MIKLNLGCGPHALKGWINIDQDAHPSVMRWNLAQGLPTPVEKESVEFIFSEHFIEHLRYEEALRLLTQCHYVLKPGAVLRLSTPDLAYLVSLYIRQDTTKWSPTWNPTTPCRMVNEGMREWGHQFLFDERELFRTLEFAGFREIKTVPHGTSLYTELQGLEVRPYINDLIVEATK